jgi:hypothetical protein
VLSCIPCGIGCCAGVCCSFENVTKAAQAVIKIVQRGPKSLCRCELLNADGIKATNVMFSTELECVATIFMEFRGATLEVGNVPCFAHYLATGQPI